MVNKMSMLFDLILRIFLLHLRNTQIDIKFPSLSISVDRVDKMVPFRVDKYKFGDLLQRRIWSVCFGTNSTVFTLISIKGNRWKDKIIQKVTCMRKEKLSLNVTCSIDFLR